MSRLLIIAALVVAPSIAFAGPSKAWTAAKKVHPDMPIIAGIDVATAKSSEAFKKFYPLMLKKEPKAQEILDRLAKDCDFDPFVAINSVVAVMDDKDKDSKGAFYIALNGWDSKRLIECGKKIAKAENKAFTAGPVKKGIQEIADDTGTKGYVGWIGKDVLVFATDPTDKAFVEKFVTGKGGGAAGKLAAKLDTSSTVWMSIIKDQEIQPGMSMKAMAAAVKIANGNVATDLKMVTPDNKQATDFVTLANKELPTLAPNLPAAAQAIIKTLKLKAVGAEVQATANGSEKDILDLIQMAMMLM